MWDFNFRWLELHQNGLIGGLEHNFYFSMYWEFHDPNWRTPIFQRGGSTTKQITSYTVGVLNVSYPIFLMHYGRWELILGPRAGNPVANIEVWMGHSDTMGELSIAMLDQQRATQGVRSWMMSVHPISYCTILVPLRFAMSLIFRMFLVVSMLPFAAMYEKCVFQ